MDDKTLTSLITEEIEYDPSLDKADIAVSCRDGIVILHGEAAYLGQKYAAEKAVGRVRGVRAIANEIQMQDPSNPSCTDHDIARRVSDMLSWDTSIPDGLVQSHVSNGRVTLTGVVDRHYQRQRAEELVKDIKGVMSLLNHIVIKPRAQQTDIKAQIKKALHRHAQVEADSIHVIVQDGSTVVLQGDVNAWHEREIAESAAWAADGVTDVIDQLKIS